jgi:hypothetical protein
MQGLPGGGVQVDAAERFWAPTGRRGARHSANLDPTRGPRLTGDPPLRAPMGSDSVRGVGQLFRRKARSWVGKSPLPRPRHRVVPVVSPDVQESSSLPWPSSSP